MSDSSLPSSTASSGAVIRGDAPAQSKPDYQRPEYVDASWARNLCRALAEGTSSVRALGKEALPKWPAEKDEHYRIRASIAQVARYYQRTVEASVGMICATPPALADDADQSMQDDWEDIDGIGTHGEVFAKHLTAEAIHGGFAAILVDSPPWPDGMTLRADQEIALGLRPHWVLITADQIISWIVDVPSWPELLEAWQSGDLTADQVKAMAKQVIVRQVV